MNTNIKPNIDWSMTSMSHAHISVRDPLDTYYCSEEDAGAWSLHDLASDFADEYLFDADSEPAFCVITKIATGEALRFIINLDGSVCYEE